jgi:signal transduction histidine kinase
MRMVIENLLDNASKYSVDGRDITITITKHTEAATIAIKDEGFGIAKDEIPLLFHKFSRLDNPLSVTVGGTGLGLYWAKRIVSLHGGTIEVKSKPGEGSIFTIVLPGKKMSI